MPSATMPITVRNTGSRYEILGAAGELMGDADTFADALFGARTIVLEHFKATKQHLSIQVG